MLSEVYLSTIREHRSALPPSTLQLKRSESYSYEARWEIPVETKVKKAAHHTVVTNGWLNHHLHMGFPSGIIRYLAAHEYAESH